MFFRTTTTHYHPLFLSWGKSAPLPGQLNPVDLPPPVYTKYCRPCTKSLIDELKPAVIEEILAVAAGAEPKLRAIVLGILAQEASPLCSPSHGRQ